MSDQVPLVPSRGRREIEQIATRFCKRFAPWVLTDPGPFPVLQVFEALGDEIPGITTGVDDMDEKTEGMLYPDGRLFISNKTYRGLVSGDGRSRFTATHEFCHALVHKPHLAMAHQRGRPPLYRRADIKPYQDPEWQADQFATRVLMPTAALQQFILSLPNKMLIVYNVQSQFQVSHEAARVRLSILKKDEADGVVPVRSE